MINTTKYFVADGEKEILFPNTRQPVVVQKKQFTGRALSGKEDKNNLALR